MGIAATKTVRRSVARNVNSSFLLGWIFVYLAGSGTRHREGKQDDNERDGQHVALDRDQVEHLRFLKDFLVRLRLECRWIGAAEAR